MSGITVKSTTQKLVLDPYSSSVAVINAGPVGPAGPTGEVSDAQFTAALATKVDKYSGTGSPEGVVTAPVGSQYIDTAATAGAIKWIKATGVGSTGWKVLYGDTGWRNVLSLIGVDYTANALKMRRINEVVRISFTQMLHPANADPAGHVIIVPPAGFQNSVHDKIYFSWGELVRSSNTTHVWLLGGQGGAGIKAVNAPFGGAPNVASSFYGGIDYTTDQMWPATLPGIAA